VVYVLPPSTSFPLVRIRKCDEKGKIKDEIGRGGFWDIKNDYDKTALSVGKAILDNSLIVKNWRKTHP